MNDDTPAEFSKFAEKLIRLDMLLTGKPRADAVHTARSQQHRLSSPLALLNDGFGGEYYLSDGGYSRLFVNDMPSLWLTSNSLPAAKAAWETPAVQGLVGEILTDLENAIELELNPPKPRGP